MASGTVPDKASIRINRIVLARVSLAVRVNQNPSATAGLSHRMEELQRLQASRNAYKSYVTRTFRRVEELMETEGITALQLTSLTTAAEQLQRRKETISQLDAQIVELLTTPESLEETILEAEDTKDSILEKINRINKFIELQSIASTMPTATLHVTAPVTSSPVTSSHSVATTSTSTEALPHITTSSTTVSTHSPAVTTTTEHSGTPIVSTHPQNASRLPKLTLPTFSGDPLTWQTFWDSFEAAVDSNPTLSSVQKFNYLKAQLQADAARAIAGLPLTEANYVQSIALLKQRFGQPQRLINAHIQAFLDLSAPSNDLSSLRLFYDLVENHIRGLSALGVPKVSYGTLLVPIILGKLSPPTRRNLAREHSNLKWTIDELQAALLKEIRILESGLYTTDPVVSMSTTRTSPATASFHAGIKAVRSAAPSGKKKLLCVYCKGEHSPTSCNVVTDTQKRLEIIKRENLCFNCLGSHKVAHCNSKFRCKNCKHKHHTSLCRPSSEEPKTNKSDAQEKPPQPPTQTVTTLTPVSCESQQTKQTATTTTTISLLKTAIAPISAEGLQISGNILFDEGSQRSFVTEEIAKRLNLKPIQSEHIAVAPFGAEYISAQHLSVAQINIESSTGCRIPISVLIVPFIAAPLQNSLRASITGFPYLQGLKLAHPITNEENFQISVLIGADFYWTFVEDHIIRGDGPTAQQSKLGYLLSGPIPQMPSQLSNALHVVTMSITTDNPNLDRFWSLEETGTTLNDSQNKDSTFLRHYQSTCISQAPDGTYTAKFPWRPDCPYLPSNFNVYQKRTKALIGRLAESPALLHLYNEIIVDQETREFIEKVPTSLSTQSTNIHYLPHHPVHKDSVTTPIRIVYDCSCCKDKGSASLNDCLLVGPPFLNDLCSIILRFRTHVYAFATDIEKAFLHVKLCKADRDSTRFLWLSDADDPTSALTAYRFKVVPFGTVSSPFMLNATLDLHLSKFSSQVAQDMKTNLYVDNLISGCNSEKEAIDYYKKARSILCEAKFNLRSWSSNSCQLRAVTSKDQTNDPNECVNLLGLRWHTLNDTLSFVPRKFQSLSSSQLVTKREILRDSAQIYDPLGFLTPVTVKAKMLVRLCGN